LNPLSFFVSYKKAKDFCEKYDNITKGVVCCTFGMERRGNSVHIKTANVVTKEIYALISTLLQAEKELEIVDIERVARLEVSIRSGTYKVDNQALADKMCVVCSR